jgi:hypothetical protein
MHGRRRGTIGFKLKDFLIKRILFYLAKNLSDLCICVTTVAMVQSPHATVGAIRCKHSCDPRNCTVEFAHSIPNRVLSSSKTNVTTLCAIIFNLLFGKMGLLNQTKWINQPTPSPSSSINAFQHPYGCASQLRPWSEGREPTKTTLIILFLGDVFLCVAMWSEAYGVLT